MTKLCNIGSERCQKTILDKAVLMIGAGNNQLPYIRQFKRRGYQIIAVDRDPLAPGFTYADISLYVSTHDSQRVLKAISALSVKDKIVAIACPTTGWPYVTASRCAVSRNLSFPSEDTVMALLDKYLMWKKLTEGGMTRRRSILSRELKTILSDIRLPCVVKPHVESGSNRGVRICLTKEELLPAFEQAALFSLDGFVIIESVCQGPEIKLAGFLQHGEVKLFMVAQRIFGTGKPGLPIGLAVGPSENPQLEMCQKPLSPFLESVCRLLGLENSPLNVDVILSPNLPEIIDFDIVLGSLQPLIAKATGVNTLDLYVSLCLEEKLVVRPRRKRGAAVTYLWCSASELAGERILKLCRRTAERQMFIADPQISLRKATQETSLRVGYIITEGATQEAAMRRGIEWLERVQIELGRQRLDRQIKVIMPNTSEPPYSNDYAY